MSGLVDDLIRALDPTAIAEAMGMALDPWQTDVLCSYHPRILMCCTRQGGKSTVASVAAVDTGVYKPGSTVLLVSPTQRQSGELFQKTMTAYRPIGRAAVAESENASTLRLENGSRIVSLPGNPETIRSFSAVDLVIIDEAARVKDDLMVAVRPMLAVSGGRLIALTTPRGKRGWFYDAWENGGEIWKRVKITAYESPRVGQHHPGGRDGYLAEERRSLSSEWYFRQEFMCEFLELAEQMFTEEQIEGAFDSDFDPL